jgi:hypothetical protein
VRLFGGLWLLGRGTGLGVRRFFWNAVHTAFSLGGDYRDPIDHSRSQELQADCEGNPNWRRSGKGGESGLPAEGGAW